MHVLPPLFSRRSRWPALISLPLLWGLVSSCDFDSGERWVKGGEPLAASCEIGLTSCSDDALSECVADAQAEGEAQRGEWRVVEDCKDQGLVCANALQKCAVCEPNTKRCNDLLPETCDPEGKRWVPQAACNTEGGSVCRAGACQDLCSLARAQKSNLGCEYWAVDLDNANVSPEVNAAAQQYAVVISNPQPDIAAWVTIKQDDTQPGTDNEPIELVTQRIAPLSLAVFPLGPREVDGSPPGEFNTGTGSALTRNAYHVLSSVPVVAVQFNPLDNVDVFSNDASLLKPVEALQDDARGMRPMYVVIGWPQTIARTDDPLTNFGGADPSALRSFLTIVGTQPGTRVRVTSEAALLGSNDFSATPAGESLEVEIGPYDVLNLETDDFNADLTGSLVEADAPVVVFSGSEASDAPWFEELSQRSCCADHLEEQLDPLRTAGKRFVGAVANNRSLAVRNAGGGIGVVEAQETFRVISASASGAHVKTTLPGALREFTLEGLGSHLELTTTHDFVLSSDAPVMLGNVSPSQEAAGVPKPLPGGDPSFLIIPPIEQFRKSYVFLTPSLYAFDFLRIIAPPDAQIVIDQRAIEELPECTNANPEGLRMALAPEDQKDFTVYRCQLSFPTIDSDLEADELLRDGEQNDGVHTILSNRKIGVLVDGFDRNVSYAYAAGTELNQIVAR